MHAEQQTYRGWRRNQFRAQAPAFNKAHSSWSQAWREMKYWVQANVVAKIKDRAQQCFDARVAWHTAQKAGGVPMKVLREFWSNQKPSRVVSRICAELAVYPIRA